MNIPYWVVESVLARDDYTLLLTFTGGEQRVYDARPLLNRKIYEPLNNLVFFMGARVEYGTVVWSNEVDIAPESLYKNSIPVRGVC